MIPLIMNIYWFMFNGLQTNHEITIFYIRKLVNCSNKL